MTINAALNDAMRGVGPASLEHLGSHHAGCLLIL
jgi:hypothetical protein